MVVVRVEIHQVVEVDIEGMLLGVLVVDGEAQMVPVEDMDVDMQEGKQAGCVGDVEDVVPAEGKSLCLPWRF